jgi:drug/metabolite transporter (DMT)-like permease
MSVTSDYLKLHFIVWIWGFTAILGLLISIPAVEIVFFRTLIAFGTLGIILLLRKTNFKVGKREIFKILGTGFIIAAHWILFFAAARVSTASVCLAGIATCSLWTSFLEPIMNRTKIKNFEVFLGLTVLGGLYVIFRFEFNHALGLGMAILSALLASIFSVINGKLTKKHNPYMITFYEMLGAWLGTLIFLPFYSYYFTNGEGINLIPVGMDWIWLAILGIVNLTVNLEPIYGIILAVLVIGEKEKMQPEFYLGTLIILLSVLAYPFLNKMHKKKAQPIDNLR